MAEKDTQKLILAYLRLHEGALAIRVNSGATFAEHKGKRRMYRSNDTSGCSDILCCVRGRFVAIEVKHGKNRPTPDQTSFLDSVTAAGGLAFVARSVRDVWEALTVEGLSAVGAGRFEALEFVYGL